MNIYRVDDIQISVIKQNDDRYWAWNSLANMGATGVSETEALGNLWMCMSICTLKFNRQSYAYKNIEIAIGQWAQNVPLSWFAGLVVGDYGLIKHTRNGFSREHAIGLVLIHIGNRNEVAS